MQAGLMTCLFCMQTETSLTSTKYRLYGNAIFG